MDDEAVRSESMDQIFTHLRTQDEAIDQLRADLQPAIEIISNLRGFALFCQRWGKRLNTALKWLAAIGPAIILIRQWAIEYAKAHFKAKGG
jgi:hypothetical protein